jgi:hypothetical protein
MIDYFSKRVVGSLPGTGRLVPEVAVFSVSALARAFLEDGVAQV